MPKSRPNGRTLPLAELKRIVLEIGKDDGWQEGDESFQAGLVLIAPLSITTMDPVAVSQFTGVPEPLVREFAGRLIENGVWRPDGKLAVQWNDPENGNLAFMMDVWVAMGELEEEQPRRPDTASNAQEPMPQYLGTLPRVQDHMKNSNGDSMSEQTNHHAERRRAPRPADLSCAAGDAAVRVYREFLDAIRSPNTRRVYGTHVRRFCSWAQARGLPLSLIAPSDIIAYLKPFSRHAAGNALSVLRRFFIPFIAEGLLTQNPCGHPPMAAPEKHCSPDRLAWELQKLHDELMAELDQRYGADPTFQLIKGIDRQLATMEARAGQQVAGTQEAADAR